MISARVAPLARPIMAMIFAPLLSARGALAPSRGRAWRPSSWPWLPSSCSGFLRAAAFLGCLALAPLAVFWPLGAPFFWLAPFFEGAFSGATCAPCSATAAVWVVSVASLVLHGGFNPFRSVACAVSRAPRFITPVAPEGKSNSSGKNGHFSPGLRADARMQPDRRSEGHRQQADHDARRTGPSTRSAPTRSGRRTRSPARRSIEGERRIAGAASADARIRRQRREIRSLHTCGRARSKRASQARTAQLEYEERAGKLIQAVRASEYAATFSAIVKDGLMAMPDRLAPMLAAVDDEKAIHRMLAAEVAAVLRKVSKSVADAGL